MALMPDVTMLLDDPDLGAQDFTVKRRAGKWFGGRFVVESESLFNAIGIIQPPTPEQLAFFPEGERRVGRIAIYTKQDLHLTEGEMISDDVTWNGEQYKIVNIERWEDYGFVIAFAEKR